MFLPTDRSLQKAGKTVICYFNAGAVQAWDEDKDNFPEDVVGKSLAYPYVGDEGEFYLDIRSTEVLDQMKARLDSAVAIGCDGVDPDNIDAWAQDGDDATGFDLQPEDYADYLKSLATYAHSLTTQSGGPLLVGQKNAPEIAPLVDSTLDFAVLESCRGTPDDDYAFCGDFQSYVAADKPVFQIEYPPSVEDTGSISSTDETYYCIEEDQDEGFSKVIKWASAQLDGWGAYCGGEIFETPTIDE